MGAPSPWLSFEEFSRYSVLQTPHEPFPEDAAPAVPVARAAPCPTHAASTKTATTNGRTRREPHSVARMGVDKLIVRASADTPYDLDNATATPVAGNGSDLDNPWFVSTKQLSTPNAELPANSAGGDDSFAAKLSIFKGR
jgi:hypothetical protein